MADQFLGVLEQVDAMGVDRIPLILGRSEQRHFQSGTPLRQTELVKIIVSVRTRTVHGIEMPGASMVSPRVVHKAKAELPPSK